MDARLHKPLDELITDEAGRPICISYDKDHNLAYVNITGTPPFTQRSHELQANNQLTLCKLLLEQNITIPKGPWADLGGGDGIFLALAPYMLFNNPLKPEIGRRSVFLFDMSERKVAIARLVAKLVAEQYERETGFSLDYRVPKPLRLEEFGSMVEYDRRFDLPAKFEPSGFEKKEIFDESTGRNVLIDDTDKPIYKTNLPKFAGAWLASVYHWIRGFEQKLDVAKRINRSMKMGAPLAAAIATGETAKDLLGGYKDIKDFFGPYSSNRPWGFQGPFIDDPIGKVREEDIKSILEQAGFEILFIRSIKEAHVFDDPLKYTLDVLIYGRNEFMNPWRHLDKPLQDLLWENYVCQAFLRRLEQKGWRHGKNWAYEQENIYVVAVKADSPSPYDLSVHVWDISSTFDNAPSLCSKMTQSREWGPLKLTVFGDRRLVEGEVSVVNLRDILDPMLLYASSCRVQREDTPIDVNYAVQGRTLKFSIGVWTQEYRPIEKILRNNLDLLRLVNAYYEQKGDHRIYTFSVPLFFPGR